MEKVKWNENWKVWKEENAFSLVFAVPQDAKNVTLPYDALFYQKQNPDSANEGKTGFMDGGTYNYYKEEIFPKEDQGKDILLLVEGCAVKTWVFVNGSLAGECDYPYMEFYVNLSPWLRYGETNRIRIVANSLDLSSRFYVGGGLFRDVSLLRGESAFLKPEGMRLTTKELSGQDALVEWENAITNRMPYSQKCRLKLAVTDDAGRSVCAAEYPVFLPAQRTVRFSRQLLMRDVVFWDEHHPALYSCSASLLDAEGHVLDTACEKTGFRTIRIDAQNGLLINSKETKLLGCCIHHDQGILGAATYDCYEYRRIKKLKEAGFNAVRSAHNPASRALLRACDELGVYLMDEAFDMWGQMKNTADFSMFFTKNYRDVLKTMVSVDYNHPSVILYSTGNEIMDAATDKGYALSNEMTQLLHDLDRTRYVTNGVNALLSAGNRLYQIAADICGQDAAQLMKGDVNQVMHEHAISTEQIVCHPLVDELLDYLDATMDVIGYNYLTERYEKDLKTHPHRVIVGTETHAKRIGDNWKLMQENKALIGDFIWTGYSYLGETGAKERFPAMHNESCDLDIIGDRRPTSYYREIVLGHATAPYLAVRPPKLSCTPMQVGPWSLTDAIPRWDYPGEEGAQTDIEVYSNGDEIELFLNDVSLGRQKTGQALPCRNCYRTPYQPGVLKAVTYRNGAVSDTCTLCTPKGPLLLRAALEENQPDARLVFVTVQAVDEEGNTFYTSMDDLTVALENPEDAPLTLLAFGSYEAPHNGGYQSPVLPVTSGNALAVFQKTGSGAARITFCATGFAGTAITINC